MKKIAFLGCENSHAETFIKLIKESGKYQDVEIVGVYSDEIQASEKLADKYGVSILPDYKGLDVDGIVVTARHGDNHLKYALPYFEQGIPMFIDKPITITEDDALTLARLSVKHKVKLTGGSSCRLDSFITELKDDAVNKVDGDTIGGFMRCPIDLKSVYGGFYFYAQHLVECVGEIFGRYPETVYATKLDKTINVVFKYSDYTVTGLYVDGSYEYYAMRMTATSCKGGKFMTDSNGGYFDLEFREFYDSLFGKEVGSLRDLIAPVFVMNAIKKSMDSDKEVAVNKFEI